MHAARGIRSLATAAVWFPERGIVDAASQQGFNERVPCVFRPIAASEVSEAYALYLGAVAWLREKNIRQWLTPASFDSFVEHQLRAELHGCWTNGLLVAIAALVRRGDSDWRQTIGPTPVWWIDTLAVARSRQGQNIGSCMLQQCEAAVAGAGAAVVYLDCHAGYLPKYYVAAGYVELARRQITYASGNTYPMVLMRKTLSSRSLSPPLEPES